MQQFVQSLSYFGDLNLWVFMLAGIIIGLVLGIIPGVGGMLGAALLLPFVFFMAPETGLPLLLAMASVAFTGGSITAILLNIPGTGPNAATMLDGFPMAQKGQAGRAIGAALASSGFGGMLSGILALAMVPVILPMVMAVRIADMVFVILMGLSFIAVLGAGSPVKGAISGGLGLLIAFIGFQAGTGVSRFTFTSLYLYDGIPLIPVVLGLFALPEMVALAMKGGTVSGVQKLAGGMGEVLEGVKDVFRHWGIFLRSSIIGYIAGIIPGVGAEVATWVCYGQAKQTSKNPEKFGTGVVEGVIAPESGNNAKEGGALLTTLAIGIPGSAVMAIIIGAMLMLGLTPGPEMLTSHLDISFNLLLVIIIANIIAALICILAAPQLARIATIPGPYLVPIVMVFIFIGAFAYRGYALDLVVLLATGALGLAMKRYGFSRPALFLGYILGYLFELYFFMAIDLSGPFFFMRPISLTLIAIIIALFLYNPIRRRFGRRSDKELAAQ